MVASIGETSVHTAQLRSVVRAARCDAKSECSPIRQIAGLNRTLTLQYSAAIRCDRKGPPRLTTRAALRLPVASAPRKGIGRPDL